MRQIVELTFAAILLFIGPALVLKAFGFQGTNESYALSYILITIMISTILILSALQSLTEQLKNKSR